MEKKTKGCSEKPNADNLLQEAQRSKKLIEQLTKEIEEIDMQLAVKRREISDLILQLTASHS